jgi:hypothetical protein
MGKSCFKRQVKTKVQIIAVAEKKAVIIYSRLDK